VDDGIRHRREAVRHAWVTGPCHGVALRIISGQGGCVDRMNPPRPSARKGQVDDLRRHRGGEDQLSDQPDMSRPGCPSERPLRLAWTACLSPPAAATVSSSPATAMPAPVSASRSSRPPTPSPTPRASPPPGASRLSFQTSPPTTLSSPSSPAAPPRSSARPPPA
jgi:hypothetical protein